MGDAEIILELTEAIRADANAPRVTQKFDPTNAVEIEIMMHEADFAVEGYMAKWSGFRNRLEDPSLYDAFVFEYQMRVRKELKGIISAAQQFIAETVNGPQESLTEPRGLEEEEPEDDEDWYDSH